MYRRILDIECRLDDATFLLGARQTGKSTLLGERFADAIYFDLLNAEVRKRFQKNPELLREILSAKEEGTLVIIDEIPKVPDLLDEVHWLMTNKGIRFVLSGSSARKLKKQSVNTLGGRAIPIYMYPLVSAEIPDFDIHKALQNGMIPRHYMVSNAQRRLSAYVDIYLKEEIKEEAAVRDVGIFERFLEVAAISDGEILNYENIATDCGVSAKTVASYFQILYDTLIGYEIPAYTKQVRRKLVQAPRFYYFDVGIANYLLGRSNMKEGTDEFGHAFEHLVIQEIIAYMGYAESKEKLTYWRTYSGIEVDAIIGDARIAIEIKSSDEIKTRHKKNLKAFAEEYPNSRKIIVSLDKMTRSAEGIEMIYVLDFFKLLWSGKII
ncbi:MAG: ATP-binding protein [Bacteroidaceae bacterium]|nr:ATP-binding protein [Bacteroidaceae bacterium]